MTTAVGTLDQFVTILGYEFYAGPTIESTYDHPDNRDSTWTLEQSDIEWGRQLWDACDEHGAWGVLITTNDGDTILCDVFPRGTHFAGSPWNRGRSAVLLIGREGPTRRPSYVATPVEPVAADSLPLSQRLKAGDTIQHRALRNHREVSVHDNAAGAWETRDQAGPIYDSDLDAPDSPWSLVEAPTPEPPSAAGFATQIGFEITPENDCLARWSSAPPEPSAAEQSQALEPGRWLMLSDGSRHAITGRNRKDTGWSLAATFFTAMDHRYGLDWLPLDAALALVFGQQS